MTCYKPRHGWRSREVEPSGKRKIVFNPSLGYPDLPVTIACRQCIGCRLEKSRQWATRCSHEASQNIANSFITLTYNDKHLPPSGSLNLRHFQLFMKRLRKHYTPKSIRFFHSGEYGSEKRRPHYHALLFGHNFEDRRLHQERKHGSLYTSEILSKIWGKGFCSIGEVNYKTAAYCARYSMKKITGEKADAHYLREYEHIDPYTGVIYSCTYQVIPEYATMSRRPGIGDAWLEKFLSDVYPDDFIIIEGKKFKPPDFYDTRLERDYYLMYQKIIRGRKAQIRKNPAEKTPARLKVREEVQEARASRLKRELE